jgi:hypothetical protein
MDKLRQQLALAEHQTSLFKIVAELLAKDSVRYRALRSGEKWRVVDSMGNTLSGAMLDATIDINAHA